MTKKIFKSNILVAVVVLIFGIACVMAILYQHFGKQIDTELKKEATYLAYGVEQNGVDYLNQIKEKEFQRYKDKGYDFVNYIHPTAIIEKDVVIGEGNNIFEGVIIQSGVRIGNANLIYGGGGFPWRYNGKL